MEILQAADFADTLSLSGTNASTGLRDRLARGAVRLLGVVFLIAGASKLVDLHAFNVAVQGIGFLPHWAKAAIVLVLPSSEIVFAGFLLLGIRLHEGALAASAVLFLFLAFDVCLSVISPGQSCPCFVSTWHDLTGWKSVGRTLLILAFALSAAWLSREPARVED